MGGSYVLVGSNLEKCGILLKNGQCFGRIWPDWENTARADKARLGSIGLSYILTEELCSHSRCNIQVPKFGTTCM